MTTQTKTNWHKIKLGEVTDINMGQSPQSQFYNSDGDGLPFFQGVTEFGEMFPKIKQWTSKVTKVAEPGDILFSVRAPVGRINYSKEKICIGRGLASMRSKEKLLNQNYLFYLLKNEENNFILQSGGSIYDSINKDKLNDFDVSIPTVDTQKQIADVLSGYDNLIENNARRIQILEQTAQAVYKEWFTSLASKKWNVSTLRDVIDSYIGGGWGKEEPDKKYSGHAYFIRGTDIPNASTGNISTCPLRYHTPSNLRTRVLQAGDLVFEVSGGSKGQPVGRSLLITNNLLDQFKQNVICASFCKLIRPDQNKISSFQLYEQILGWYKNGVIEKYQVQSTGISNFRFESFIDEEKVILPPEEIREKFDHLVSPLFDEIYSLGKQNQNLRQTRNLLLPKLITGEIKV